MKKAQIWFTDFMIGLMIFVIVIFIYYEYAYGIEQNPSEMTSDLIMDAKSISSSLVTAGSPAGWNASNVNIIGITDGNQRIVQSKIDALSNISYSSLRTKLRTSYDYYITFKELNGSIILSGGKEGIGLKANTTVDAVNMPRVLIYNSRIINMVVQVWR